MADLRTLYEELHSYIADLWVVDTHEHTAMYKQERHPDYLKTTLNTYARQDMCSAGMTAEELEKARNPQLPLMERWLICEPYWQACRNTGYIRMHELAARELHGVDGVNRDTIVTLSRHYAETDAAESYAAGLEKAKILCGIVDPDMSCDRRFLRPAFRLEAFVERTEIAAVRKMLNVPIHTFIDWLNACEEAVRRYVEGGAVAFKTTIATDRSLDIEWATYQEAEESFIASMREDGGYQPPSSAYQAFMFRHVLSLVKKHGLPVQMHTGMAASNKNVIRPSNPSRLGPLFLEYRDVEFVLMHMGYPYYLEMSALGKMYPNVYPDLSWAHIMSPHGARLALSEWLDAVPATKIMGFGGDCGHEDHVYAHLLMARENIARVLAQKVQEGCFDMSHAKWIARQILLMNPYRVFRLEKAGITLKN